MLERWESIDGEFIALAYLKANLHLAIRQGEEETALVLLGVCEPYYLRDRHGHTPITYAEAKGLEKLSAILTLKFNMSKEKIL